MRLVYTAKLDPESGCAILAAVRAMAGIIGCSQISMRIALEAEECKGCRVVSETFIEPAGVCTACWSILALHGAVAAPKFPIRS